MTRTLPLLASIALVSAALLATGCSDTSAGGIRRNPTPELAHVNRSTDQVRNDHARILDNNKRALWDDIDRFLLVDHTSRNQPVRFP